MLDLVVAEQNPANAKKCSKVDPDNPTFSCPFAAHPLSPDHLCWAHTDDETRRVIKTSPEARERRHMMMANAGRLYDGVTEPEAAHKLVTLAHGRLDILLAEEATLTEEDYNDGTAAAIIGAVNREREHLINALKVAFGTKAVEAMARLDQASQLNVKRALAESMQEANLTPEQQVTLISAFARNIRARQAPK